MSRMKPDRLAVWITWSSRSSERVLRLIPRAVVLGMGCRRGIPASQLEAEALAALEEGGVDRRAVRAIASADLKKEEEGLKELARMWNVPFLTFSREAMERIPGSFSSSEFVRQTAGVDCVCERAAMAAVLERKNGGFLLAGKRKGRGITTCLLYTSCVAWYLTQAPPCWTPLFWQLCPESGRELTGTRSPRTLSLIHI